MVSAEIYGGSSSEFAERHFGECQLGDVRRTRQAVYLAAGFAESPGATIPELCDGRSAGFNALYNLLKRPEARPGALQKAHRDIVRSAIADLPGRVVLVVEDGSDASWSGKAPVKGLGPISNGAPSRGSTNTR